MKKISYINIRAFTLIELLVVVGIIALLATMLMPALGKSRQKARNVHCQGNLRQFGILARVYADDHEERYPVIHEDSGGSDGSGQLQSQFRRVFAPLAQSPELFKCRSDDSEVFDQGGSSYQWNPVWNRQIIDRPRSSGGMQDQPLIEDSNARHPSGAKMLKNAVYEDGHIDSF